MINNAAFLPKLKYKLHEVILKRQIVFHFRKVYEYWYWNNLERRLSAIYKEDFVLLYTNSNDVFTTLLKPFKI
jgi:hypothetical protein